MEGQMEFSMDDGEARKQAGMDKAINAERVVPWVERADASLDRWAASGRDFTIDNIVAEVGLPSTGQNRNGAVGALINSAARRHRIRRVGWSRTERKMGNARVVGVWRGV